MYTMLNNPNSSKFDLYLPGELVASLHYAIRKDENEILVVYCEAIEQLNSATHCKELMKRAMADMRNRRMRITVTCPIATRHLREFSTVSG